MKVTEPPSHVEQERAWDFKVKTETASGFEQPYIGVMGAIKAIMAPLEKAIEAAEPKYRITKMGWYDDCEVRYLYEKEYEVDGREVVLRITGYELEGKAISKEEVAKEFRVLTREQLQKKVDEVNE